MITIYRQIFDWIVKLVIKFVHSGAAELYSLFYKMYRQFKINWNLLSILWIYSCSQLSLDFQSVLIVFFQTEQWSSGSHRWWRNLVCLRHFISSLHSSNCWVIIMLKIAITILTYIAPFTLSYVVQQRLASHVKDDK